MLDGRPNVFLTGRAGAGKTTLIKSLLDRIPGEAAVLARRDRFIPLRKSDLIDGLLAAGTAAIGSEMFGHRHRAAEPTAVASLPAVTVTGHRTAVADAVTLPEVRVTGHRLTATAVAVVVVLAELSIISWVRHKYMDTPLVSALLQVMLGGALVFLAGILIGIS